MKINIEIKDDYRSFLKGRSYIFNFTDGEVNFIVGRNGCGKSTLMRLFRKLNNPLREKWLSNRDGIHSKCLEDIDTSKFEVTDFDYDNAFYLDAVADGPESWEAVTTGAAFVSGGAMTCGKVSRGQKMMRMYGHILGEIAEFYKTHEKGNDVIIFDEIDEGFAVHIQLQFAEILKKEVARLNPKMTVICVTHNPFVYINHDVHDVELFGHKFKGYEYFTFNTGYEMSIKKYEKSE